MRYGIGVFVLISAVMTFSCGKAGNGSRPDSAGETPAAAQESAAPSGGPHAIVHLKNGSTVPGEIIASTQTDMVVAGDDGIERKIPLSQVKSVEYAEAATSTPPAPVARTRNEAQPRRAAGQTAGQPERPAPAQTAAEKAPETAAAPVQRMYEVPAGREISVRTNEAIDSRTAAEGQTFDAQVTRDISDASGAVVIPRGADARIVIRSVSQGGRIRGASDLVLDLQSVVIRGRSYAVETSAVAQKGKAGVGANKRTAEYTGGGAALGAVIGAIAGGGKGAAIGAGAGAGAGALTQIITKGSIKVPAESVLTFSLEKPLTISAVE